MRSYKVVIWKLSLNRSAKKPTYLVRWSVDGEPFHESFKTTALADRFRARLLRAADKGEPFDTVTGLPDSLRRGKAALSFLDLARKYVDVRWAEASAKQRDSMTDALATVVPALVKPGRGRPAPEVLRRLCARMSCRFPFGSGSGLTRSPRRCAGSKRHRFRWGSCMRSLVCMS
ncbi:hypothetical protein SUDANB148_04737 [Streptomyces sp. SudanB148_2056]